MLSNNLIDKNNLIVEENMYTCRICLEDDIDDNMIYPCRCAGTSKYVHKECLNQWRVMSEEYSEAFTTCPTCNYDYNIVAGERQEDKFLMRCMRSLIRNLFVFLIFNISIIIILTCFIETMDHTHELPRLISDIDKNYIINGTDYNNYLFTYAYYDIYLLLSSSLYLVFMLCMGIATLYNSKINKCLYLKYISKCKCICVLSFLIPTIIFFLNSIFGLTIITLCTQLLFNIHFNTIDKIKLENTMIIMNYEQTDERT